MKLKDGLELTLRKAEKGDAADILAYLNQVGGESDNLLFGKDGMQLPVEAEEEFIESVNACKTSVLLVGLADSPLVAFLSTLDIHFTAMSAVHITMWLLLAGTAVYGAIFYFLTTYFLKKRLNLE